MVWKAFSNEVTRQGSKKGPNSDRTAAVEIGTARDADVVFDAAHHHTPSHNGFEHLNLFASLRV
jgi:hypothetical protein